MKSFTLYEVVSSNHGGVYARYHRNHSVLELGDDLGLDRNRSLLGGMCLSHSVSHGVWSLLCVIP